MGLFKYWEGSRYIMHLLIIKLLCCLVWPSSIAFGQLELSESVSGSVSVPDLVITCLGNIAVFYSSILRGRLYLEMGAKDALTILTGWIKLKSISGMDIYGFGLTTCEQENLSDCSVVMLSQETPNCSMKQFVEYIANVYNMRSVILQYLPLESAAPTVETCTCLLRARDRSYDNSRCGCIVLGVDGVITTMLAEQIPRTLKLLSQHLCLLPSLDCLKNGCHGCSQGLLHMKIKTDEFGITKSLEESNDKVEPPAAVCGTPYSTIIGESGTCICIPVPQAGYERVTDRWTELLIGSFKSKDYVNRGAIIRREMNSVSQDLENYMARRGECWAVEEYSVLSLILPRLAEILINVVLTFWFKVDGFSSALVARRAVRDYIVDNRGRGFAAHLFITKAEVRSNAQNTNGQVADVGSNTENTNVYQVLSFRGNLFNPRTLSLIVSCVNLICSVTWAVLVALEGGANKWYHTHSMPPSNARVAVIFAAIVIALSMECFDLHRGCLYKGWLHRKTLVVCTMIALEILCIVSVSIVAKALGIKVFGRWVYGAVQGLVWVKWGMGSYLLGQYIPRECRTPPWMYGSIGRYMYSSAFFLNAVLAGARAKWDFS